MKIGNKEEQNSATLERVRNSAIGTVFKIFGVLLMVIAGGLSMVIRHVPEGSLIVIGLMIFCSWAGYKLFKRGKKMKMALAEVALVDDPRAPILYLRSFGSDAEADKAAAGSLGNHIFRFAIPQNLATEEEQIAMLMNKVGPFMAIGRPGEKLPQLGAYRTYIDDFASEGESLDLFWKSKILELMDASCLVVLRVGETEGFWWEVGNIPELLGPKKVVFLLPENKADYERFRKKAEEYLPVTLPDYKPKEISDRSFGGVLWFMDDWTPQIEYCESVFETFSNQVASDLNRMMKNVWAQLGIKVSGFNDKPAPIGRRLLAQLIDIGIFSAIILLGMFGFSFMENTGSEDNTMLAVLAIPVGVYIYFGVLEASRWGGTPGKVMLGLRTQDKNGTPITMQQGLLRFVFKIFGAIIWPITIILIALGKVTMHDKFAKTRVVIAEKK